jgi:hypothetical protein
MPFEVFSNTDIRNQDKLYITIDKNKRIYLNRPLQRYLGLPVKVFLAFDSTNKRIGLAKADVKRLPGVKPFTFGKAGFISARPFVDRFKIPVDELEEGETLRFKYFGEEDDFMSFQLEEHEPEDDPRRYRGQKDE